MNIKHLITQTDSRSQITAPPSGQYFDYEILECPFRLREISQWQLPRWSFSKGKFFWWESIPSVDIFRS